MATTLTKNTGTSGKSNTISNANIDYLRSQGCDPADSTFNGHEVIKISNKNLSNMPNRQVLLFVADVHACLGNTGTAQDLVFPQDFITPAQVSKIKFDLKPELDKFDSGNSKESIDYITGYTSPLSFEASFMNLGVWKKFIDDKILAMPIGNKALVATLLVYGVTNPRVDKDWNITGDDLEAFLKIGPLEAGELIATGDDKKMSITKFTQHTSLDAKRIQIPNTNGQFNHLINAMFGIEDIQEDVWDNENPQKLLK